MKMEIDHVAARELVLREYNEKKAAEEALKAIRKNTYKEDEKNDSVLDSTKTEKVTVTVETTTKTQKWVTISDDDESGIMIRG